LDLQVEKRFAVWYKTEKSEKMKTLFVFAFLLCISAGFGLKCYICFSYKNWDDCPANNNNTETCNANADRCIKAKIVFKKDGKEDTSYVRGCATSEDCDKGCVAKQEYTIEDCDYGCCKEDLCNGAKVPMVSAIILVACTVVAFIR